MVILHKTLRSFLVRLVYSGCGNVCANSSVKGTDSLENTEKNFSAYCIAGKNVVY